jgi:pimeloyl-ACP methyl ester carboxylesterase
MQSQPAHGWSSTIHYVGWRDVPSLFIVTQKDQLLPGELQKKMAAMAGSQVVTISAGHMAQISQTKEVAKIVGGVLAGPL